jgi:hypothetical protein
MSSFIKFTKKTTKSCDCDYECNATRFKQNFKNWTSGNKDIDKFIQGTQLSEYSICGIENALEWIPYDRFYSIKYISECRFGKVYRANWTDGHMNFWSDGNQNWEREDQNMFVILKSIDNMNIVKFINKVKLIYHLM